MNIAFFGTPAFTTDFLDMLENEGFFPSLVVTNPNRPVGRGMTLTAPAPKIWAEQHSITVLQPEKITEEFYSALGTDWDLFIVIAYGKILPEKLISIPRLGTINVHYSLLPKYRGATPVEAAILNGDTETGVSIQHMVFDLDAGPVIAEEIVPIEPSDTTPSLRAKLNAVALTLLPHVVKSLAGGTAQFIEQDHVAAIFTKKIKKDAGLLDIHGDSIINDRKYRAYAGSIGTYFFHDGVRMKIKTAHLEDRKFVIDEVIPENGKLIRFLEEL